MVSKKFKFYFRHMALETRLPAVCQTLVRPSFLMPVLILFSLIGILYTTSFLIFVFLLGERVCLSDSSVWAHIHKYALASASPLLRLKSWATMPCNFSPLLLLLLCLPVSSSGCDCILNSVLPVTYSLLNSVQTFL